MSNDSLFRWQRITQPRVYSHTQAMNSRNGSDIQDWIKTVEEASARAAAATFGQKAASAGKRAVQSAVINAHLHEAAFTEAQDLLEQWAAEKLDFSDAYVDTDRLEIPTNTTAQTSKTAAEIKREWDHLTEVEIDDTLSSVCDTERKGHSSQNSKRHKNNDPFSLLNADEDAVIDSILRGMLDKELVKDEFKSDLGFNAAKNEPDPRMKMHVRHQQVKENRERRTKEKQDRLRRQQNKKDAELQVRQLIQKEEKVREMKRRKEEEEIQKEMAQIRKEMDEERRSKAAEELRRKQQLEKLENEKKAERERQEAVERQARLHCQQQDDERHQKILAKLEEIQKREIKESLMLKRVCFSSWYNVVIERRLQLGKAKAMADWKIVLRAFSAWRSVCLKKWVKIETDRHEHNVKQEHRNELKACEHYRRHLLMWALAVWHLYVMTVQRKREMEQARQTTQNKMAAFLNAAASGQLWTDRTCKAASDESEVPCAIDAVAADVPTKQLSNSHRPLSACCEPAVKSATTRCATNRSTSARQQSGVISKPTEAWQVTRQHLQLVATKNDSVSESHDESVEMQQSQSGSQSGRVRSGRGGGSFAVNSFEHRHRAQQQLLEQQQQQLREQRRLIEEMQALQRQQLLQQRLAGVQQAKSPNSGRHFEPSHLHSAIASIQHDVLQDVEAANTDHNVDAASTDRSVDAASTDRTAEQITSARSNASSCSNASSKPAVDPRHTKFLEAMQQRAAERERLRKEREERKQKLEQEKLLQLQREAEERRLKEEEDKKEKLRLLRERKDMEKKKEAERLKEAERMNELLQRAVDHHNKSLIKFRGWRPWHKLIQSRRKQQLTADAAFTRCCLRRVLLTWNAVVVEELTRKRLVADDMHCYFLVKRCFADWKKCKQIAEIDERKAVRFHARNFKLKLLRAWVDAVASEKQAAKQNNVLAEQHSIERIKRNAFRAWKRFPAVVRDAEKMKRRFDDMRKAVTALVPDFSASSTPSYLLDSVDCS